MQVEHNRPLMSPSHHPTYYINRSQKYCPQFNPDRLIVGERETNILQPALGLCRLCYTTHLPSMLSALSTSLPNGVDGIILEYYGVLNFFLLTQPHIGMPQQPIPPLLKSNEITHWLNSEMELFELLMWQAYTLSKPQWFAEDNYIRINRYRAAQEKCAVTSVISKYRQIFSEGISRYDMNADTTNSTLWTGLMVNPRNEVASLIVRARTHEIAKLKLFEQMVMDIGPGDEFNWPSGHEETFEALHQVKLEPLWGTLKIEWFMP
jgi:hypothetical protein